METPQIQTLSVNQISNLQGGDIDKYQNNIPRSAAAETYHTDLEETKQKVLSQETTATSPDLISIGAIQTTVQKHDRSTAYDTVVQSVDQLNLELKPLRKLDLKRTSAKSRSSSPVRLKAIDLLVQNNAEQVQVGRKPHKLTQKADSAVTDRSVLSQSFLLGDRKTMSLNDLPAASSKQAMAELQTEFALQKLIRTSKLKQHSMTQEERRADAAYVIQRYYRLYRMRKHFNLIVQNVNQKQQTSSKADKRKSVVYMLMHASTMNRATEQSVLKSLAPVIPSNAPQSAKEVSQDSLYNGVVSGAISTETNTLTPAQEDRIDKLLRKHINMFNIDSQKGMKALLKDKCLPDDMQSVAKFLLSEARLSKTKVGEYLGAGEMFQNGVLHCFISLLDFTDQTFDEALRNLLRTFRLPGEAQKIDRIMNEFALRYCANNPLVFSSFDTAYVLAYSLIMLNTDAHNPNVRKKMSLQDFIRNNRGIDNKQDLPKEFLEKLYTNIVHNQIRMNEHDNVFQIQELCNRIEGKYEPIAEPHRRLVGEFLAYQVPDVHRLSYQKHERVLYLFNDLLMVTKPKVFATSFGTASTVSTVNELASSSTATLKAEFSKSLVQQIPLKSAQISQKSSLMSTQSRPLSALGLTQQQRYVFRDQFNLVTMTVQLRPVMPHYPHLLVVSNDNGILLYLHIPSDEVRHIFINRLNEQITDIQDAEEEKRLKLQALTQSKAETAKDFLERTYSMKAAMPSHRLTESVTAPISQENRYSKYGSLREARQVLYSQSTIIRGSNKKVKKEVLHPDVVSMQERLAEFGVKLQMANPSPSPDAQAMANNSVSEEAAVVQDDVVPSQERSTEPRKRRNSLE